MVLPGQELNSISQASSGPGTYLDQSVIRSTVIGTPETTNGLVTVQNRGRRVPCVGDEVLCKIVKISINMAQALIVAIRDTPLDFEFLAVIRLNDIRKHEIEKLKVEECFRPGDIVRARVISLGDSKSFFLSTAEAELGVVLAYTSSGSRLFPLNWEEMIEPISSQRECRKVAKPVINC